MAQGRKNFGEEIQLIRRYSELSEPFFNFLKDKITKGTEAEKWEAVKVLKGAYEKMIPQDLTSGGESIKINFDGIFASARQAKKYSSEHGEVQSD
jgi:hypothetical protein